MEYEKINKVLRKHPISGAVIVPEFYIVYPNGNVEKGEKWTNAKEMQKLWDHLEPDRPIDFINSVYTTKEDYLNALGEYNERV